EIRPAREMGQSARIVVMGSRYSVSHLRSSAFICGSKASGKEMTSEMLAAVPLFSGVSAEILAQLSAAMTSRRLSRGQTLFFKGDPGDHLYVIQSGEVKLVLTGGEGQESILDVMKAGDYFGEMSLFDEEPRSADAVALQPAILLALHR